MEDRDVLKGLECCCREACLLCPYGEQINCIDWLISDVAELVEKQQEKIDSLVDQLAEVCL